MAIGPKPLSASLTTIELTPAGEGTLLVYTEQGAFCDGADSAQGREEGCRGPLEKLAARRFEHERAAGFEPAAPRPEGDRTLVLRCDPGLEPGEPRRACPGLDPGTRVQPHEA